MGSSAQLYNLGWSNFEQSLKQTVAGLRSHGDLFDVTLAADGKTFPAHKLVLSASSPLLLDLLKVRKYQIIFLIEKKYLKDCELEYLPLLLFFYIPGFFSFFLFFYYSLL